MDLNKIANDYNASIKGSLDPKDIQKLVEVLKKVASEEYMRGYNESNYIHIEDYGKGHADGYIDGYEARENEEDLK